MLVNSSIDILDIEVSKFDEITLIEKIKDAIQLRDQLTIAYANVNFINIAQVDKSTLHKFNKIDIIHPDGIGIFLASKFLYGNKGFNKRFTGSDFYHLLIKAAIKERWSFFFFGDKDETLQKISSVHPDIIIAGYHNGFTYENDKLFSMINNSKPDILVVGMGAPKQEDWIISCKRNLDVKIVIAVGDGIKVFSNTKKRGPKVFQKLGLEWLVRLFFEPKRLWKRYIIGIPLFIFRLVRLRFSKN
ncbi:MAG: WecB/TagA/CpsF family glycosyltransferase [Ignavibacteria bacterium]|nr:WecB/TagA/CpsF family glycosyltransferase [Ignavibacteria bacterium]MBT8392349.1 WecB/TagA/CpsF family glycosyltransferase [Ignavibacteria bacterium]NNL22227.1 WecB/TagA/CpsF family glycosyltransferase [Ignavibacteriaceae bacterium]